MMSRTFRIATYNIHKCRGMDRRVRPARIAEVLGELDADVIALQEVLNIEGGAPADNQAGYIAEVLRYHFLIGENRRLNGGAYGNVLLSRLPLVYHRNYDLTWRDRERRGCLRGDVVVNGDSPALVHVYNVHLGTAFIERRHQARRLVGEEILGAADLGGARIVVGDFNEWTRGLASRLLGEKLVSVDVRAHLGGRARTYPGVLPLLHLDHIYYDRSLRLKNFTLHRSRTALLASDHLPLVADFSLGDKS
ncbi:MAG TPA: endonuclease/exonuclease/phosphatase family protein [Pyrinomonadaceae bacterium]|nr:endonuclease/exonuclease/phosphatase family protein [Pyrinomonadaceae bacterium]